MVNRVCIIGLGYVGLPSAVLLAKHGVEVIGVDIDAERVAAVNLGRITTNESGLDQMLRDVVSSGMLRAQDAPIAADAFIIAVPTPVTADYTPDLSQVRAAVNSLAYLLEVGNLVVVESTLPVGGTEMCCEWLAEARSDLSFPHRAGESSDIRVGYCPERVLPGNTLFEMTHNDRVMGGITPACSMAVSQIYQVFSRGACHTTDVRTAELVKLVENAYRDVNIAFANEISNVCNALSVDPWLIRDIANSHPRVAMLRQGPGVGGHCISVDPWFMVHSAPDETPLVRIARQVNSDKPRRVAEQVISVCKTVEDPVIACLGLAYKADTDDLRGSPSISVIQQLGESFHDRLLIVEPNIAALPSELAGYAPGLVDLNTALEGANVIVLLTDHKEFHRVSWKQLSGKGIVDTRGIWRKNPNCGVDT